MRISTSVLVGLVLAAIMNEDTRTMEYATLPEEPPRPRPRRVFHDRHSGRDPGDPDVAAGFQLERRARKAAAFAARQGCA